MLRFEWDREKAAANLQKHGVTFPEASTVFGDPLSATVLDALHSSSDEERHVTMGMSSRGRLLVVVHCERQGAMRIISARTATRREKRFYEETGT